MCLYMCVCVCVCACVFVCVRARASRPPPIAILDQIREMPYRISQKLSLFDLR